ncbi:MAG: hydroxymyristoyl-ACP dehydratase [Bacteroidales bacterium]|jgi:3-hydroxymyristoyl/3-hydroxydecanoyl-(acyl carrier protein) dehydratase|nr:hydroxymyristoyl-ACP dehydratase [Bacteroidales bacterium]MBP5704476.1 hydroxymyristoyl-ACP dehydratase [Paludibacteraceae bacterium]MBR6597270.1 hydroxymyristoyl-ACP dehydratase [Paludibacteraceae bacterium]MCQ2189626.1 hydroxymyristoyl-ACP dehydratase [Paludibacteraceae bacterium]MEE1084451.1 hydroxymyristoyl-ACP dehydratase [Paludibacteraceae bacterium]
MKQPLYEGESIKKLIPQRMPIMMVDTFYDATPEEGHTGLTVAEDNFFCREGHFIEPGLIEHIAQSASAFAGYNAIAEGKETPIGFIGEVKNFKMNFLPKAGDRILTEIKIQSVVMNITLLTAEAKVDGNVAASCTMKIFIKE